MPPALLSVRDLSAEFPTKEGLVRAISHVGFDIKPGEVVALVGESGSGKTSTALAIMRLLPAPGRITGGKVLFDGADLLQLDEEPMRRLRGSEISMIFQDPVSGLNPVISVGEQVAEIITSHENVSKQAALSRATEVMARVGLPRPEDLAARFPFELSGGMAQRVMIAIAMALSPRLLIADEPTSALDVTIQAQILDQIERLRRESNTAVLLITHDLGVVAQIADRMVVIYGGSVIEASDTVTLFSNASHPYTSALMDALPRIDAVDRRLAPIPGDPPSLLDLPTSAPFSPAAAAPSAAAEPNRCRRWRRSPTDTASPATTRCSAPDRGRSLPTVPPSSSSRYPRARWFRSPPGRYRSAFSENSGPGAPELAPEPVSLAVRFSAVMFPRARRTARPGPAGRVSRRVGAARRGGALRGRSSRPRPAGLASIVRRRSGSAGKMRQWWPSGPIRRR